MCAGFPSLQVLVDLGPLTVRAVIVAQGRVSVNVCPGATNVSYCVSNRVAWRFVPLGFILSCLNVLQLLFARCKMRLSVYVFVQDTRSACRIVASNAQISISAHG